MSTNSTILMRSSGSRQIVIYPPGIPCDAHPGSPVFSKHWAIVWWIPSMPDRQSWIVVSGSKEDAVASVESSIGPGDWREEPCVNFTQELKCEKDVRINSGALTMAINVLRRAGKDEVADALEASAHREPTNSSSNIQWLILPDETEAYYTNLGDGSKGDASELIARINSDASLNLGHTDWRLPSIDELKSLIGTSKAPKQGWYWSSSPYVGDSYYAWYVNFYDGSVGGDYRGSGSAVRLVRASQ